METGRLEALSDGVFAFALTVLVLGIAAPAAGTPLGTELLALWPSFVTYAVSFLLIGTIWNNHDAMFRHIARADQTLLLLNRLHLVDVAFLPFPTAVLALAFIRGTDEPVAAAFCGATLTFGAIVVNVMWRYAARDRALLNEDLPAEKARQISRRFLVGLLVSPFATVLGLVIPELAMVLCVGLTGFYLWPRHAAPRAHGYTPTLGPTRGASRQLRLHAESAIKESNARFHHTMTCAREGWAQGDDGAIVRSWTSGSPSSSPVSPTSLLSILASHLHLLRL